MRDFDMHTMLRPPTGILYAQGVQANVHFVDTKPVAEHPWTARPWVYDLRTKMHITLKQNTLTRAQLDEFFACCSLGQSSYERTESERFRSFTDDELAPREIVGDTGANP